MKKRILSGMRPTGKLHLGHLVGALDNWVKLQEEYECFFMVADWHALMGEYASPKTIIECGYDNVLDWLCAGIDPKKSTVFVQSQVPAHLELFMIFSCITPLGLLERCPTYKEQLREVTTRDLNTYGFLGYPVLQAADILIYKANKVPVGEDQLAHLELTREIARKFNNLYKKEIFPQPDAILTPVPRLLGLDKRKMSKSYNNTINLSDSVDEIAKKVTSMVTDPGRIKMSDPGHPKVCNVYDYYCVFAPDKKEEAYNWCTGAQKGCVQCKKEFACALIEKLGALQKKRRKLEEDKSYVADILKEGTDKAREITSEVLKEAKKAMGLE
ncbi:MAG: tryptophan--tRNA ligase [Candidatus Omnitrophica bacterium]|jgi:tryptophanyl-tRNA synthetase|nr:tryptophan--tRNA ligase [Candidatus Omnitrophota bacterium]